MLLTQINTSLVNIIRIQEKIIASTSKLSISIEMGINDFDVSINIQAALRLKTCFEQGPSKVDQRWFTGAWGSEAGIPDADIAYYITSPTKGGLVSELDLQNINLTSRMCGCKIILPPFKTSNLKSGTLTLSMSEMMLIVSSSLPRMFLSEEIPINDLKQGGTGSDFPNEGEDFIYKSVSGLDQIARVQMSLTGLAVVFQPSLPIYNAPESNGIFNAKKLTFLGSHDISELDIKGSKKHLFFSTILEGAHINIDFDVISSILLVLCSFKDCVPFNISSGHENYMLDLISAFNITNRFSANQMSFSLLRQQMHPDKERTLMKPPPAVVLLRLGVDNVELGMQVFLCGIGSSEKFLSAKGRLGSTCLTTKTPHYPSAASDKLQADREDAVICSFGSVGTDESYSIAFRFEKGQTPGSLNVRVMISDGDIHIRRDLDAVLVDIMDSILRQGWQVPASSSLEESTTAMTTDWRLQIVSRFLLTSPDKINFINIAIKMNSISVCLPLHGKEEKVMTLVCDYFHIYSGYLRNATLAEVHLKDWNSFYRDKNPGFHHSLSSRQKVLVDDSLGAARELISGFSTSSYLHPSDLRWSIDECSLSIEELHIVHELKETVSILQNKLLDLQLKTKASFATPQFDLIATSDNSPLLQMYTASIREISRTRLLLSETKECLLLKDNEALKAPKESDEIVQLQKLLFCAEMERLAALSLVSHQMSGFIRMSATAMSGQRFVSATAFWSFYAVLRDSHLVIFKDTSQVR